MGSIKELSNIAEKNLKKEKKNYKKIIPPELVKVLGQIQVFQTPRLARELWDIGEKIFKKEKVWNHSKKSRYVTFNPSPREYYDICHKKIQRNFDSLMFNHIDVDRIVIESTSLTRFKSLFYSHDKLRGEILSVLLMDGEKEKAYVSFQ